MKTTITIITLFLLTMSVIAQNEISVSQSKATHIICPEKVSYLQVGDHTKIMAEVVPEHPNLIRVKAVEDFDGKTSLTVVYANKVYALFVDYADTTEISYRMESFAFEKTGENIGSGTPDYLLKELSHQILSNNHRYVFGRKMKKDGIRFRLTNIFLKMDVLFFELEITNRTNMGYNIEDFHWWIADKKQYKATNVQEYQVEPEYQHYNIKYIPARTILREIFVLPKLTIPDKRSLRVEMLEKALGNTGRKLTLDILNKDIMYAGTIR